jgi:Ca-activated chloride channel family protein
MIGDFHFIRPWWLTALVPLALLVWMIYRRQNASRAWRNVIAPHLLPFLVSGANRRSRISPLLFIAIGWAVSVIAIAGPTWRREPAPFAEETAPLAIVIKVSPSMMTEDIEPSRLARSVQKIHDLLSQRPGAKTALIAYAGSSHLVMPVTTDGGIIDTFAQSLDPHIMPQDGDVAADAMRQANDVLSGNGSILWITDSIAPEQVAPLASWRKSSRIPVRLLAPLLAGGEFDSLSKSAGAADASVVRVTSDDSDISSVVRAAKFDSIAGDEAGNHWQESGYWLAYLVAALSLPFFRKGWMVSTAARG